MLSFVIAALLTSAPPDEVRAPAFEDCKVTRNGTVERCYVSATRALIGKQCSLFVLDIDPLPSVEEICVGGSGASDDWRESPSLVVVLGDACPCKSKSLVARAKQNSFALTRHAEKIEVSIGSQRTSAPKDPVEFPTAHTRVWSELVVAGKFSAESLTFKAPIMGFRDMDSSDDAVCIDAARKYPAAAANSYVPVVRCKR